MDDALHSALAAVAISLSALGLGRPLARWLVPAPCDALAVTVWSLALGMLVAGSVWLLAGWAGLAGLPLAAALVLAGWLWGAVELACAADEAIAILRLRMQAGKNLVAMLHGATGRTVMERTLARARLLAGGPRHATDGLGARGGRWLVGWAGLIAGAALVGALAPPISPEALSRWLEIAKQMLLSGRIAASGSEAPGVNLVHCWFAWALALDGPVAVKVLHWGLGILLAGATVLLARPLVGQSAALVAGALVLVCPGVEHQMSLVPADDLAMALFGALALAATLRAWQAPLGSDWGVVAGVMLGGALSVRCSAVALAAAIAVGWLYQARSRSNARGELLQSGRRALVATVGVALPWLAAGSPTVGYATPQSFAAALAHLGPVAWLTPAVWLFARRLPGLGPMLGISAAYAMGASLLGIGGRWWAPLAPPLCVAAAWGWAELGNLPLGPRRIACLAIGVLAVAAPMPCFDNAAGALAVATGWQSREDYLAAREPSYRAASVFNRIRGPGDRLICQSARTFYFDGWTRRLDADREGAGAGGRAAGRASLVRRARELGFSYVLADESLECAGTTARTSVDAGNASGRDPSAGAGGLPIGEVIPILEYRFADDKGRPVRYSLLRIGQNR